jgi:hypothetical protein
VPDPDIKPQNPHPEEWQRDLNPDFLAGQNFTARNADTGLDWPTAFDVKELHRQLSGMFDDDELKGVPVVPVGTRLKQGATYIDLREQPAVELTATADMEAGRGNWYVPKTEVDYRIWNRLIGVDNPARLEETA